MSTDVSGSGARKSRKPNRNGSHGAESTPHGRTPPHNIDAERSLLGGVLLDREAPLKEIFSICAAADFYRDAHRKIAESMLSLLEDGIAVDRVSVVERLTIRGDLANIGGEEFVEDLDKIVPTAANLTYYAKIIHDKARARKLIETASSIAQLGYDQHGDVGEFIAEAERRIKIAVDGESPELVLPDALKISRELLTKTPPPRRFMLRDANTNRGVFLSARVGLFAAAGGTGKSSSFGQLAVAMATGLTWFGPGGWVPTDTMRVLLLAGEDDREELERRLFFSARDIGALSDESLDLIVRNITAWPLAGRGCALTTNDSLSKATLLPETPFAVMLRQHIREEAARGRAYGLILVDPLSRFAGFDVEKDNAAATRWVQVVESLTSAECGSPGVIAAHHLKKRGSDDRSEAVDLIRGASALKDGVRWAAVLEQLKRSKGGPDLLTLNIVKANGVPPQVSPLVLCRPDKGNEGVLRVATPDEVATNEKLVEATKTRKELTDDLRTQIQGVMDPERAYSRRDLQKLCNRRKGTVDDVVNQLLTEGVLEEPRRGVLRLNKQLDLTNGSRGSHIREPSAQADLLPGSRVPSPPLPRLLSREGDGNHGTRGGSSADSFAQKEARTGEWFPNGNQSREPLEEPPPPSDQDAR